MPILRGPFGLKILMVFLLLFSSQVHAQNQMCRYANDADFRSMFWNSLNETRNNCLHVKEGLNCPVVPAIWPNHSIVINDTGVIIDMPNMHDFPAYEPYLKNIVKNLAERLTVELGIPVSLKENRKSDNDYGNLLIFITNAEVINMVTGFDLSEVQKERFESFLKDEGTTSYRLVYSKSGKPWSILSAFVYIKEFNSLDDVSTALEWQILQSFGLSYSLESTNVLTRKNLDQMISMTSLLYNLPYEEMKGIQSIEDVETSISKHCSTIE